MASLSDQLGSLVYSTEKGDICPGCQSAIADCCCAELADKQRLAELDGIVRIRRETSGRKGKAVTTLTGIALPEAELKTLAKSLKKSCGTGGSVQNSVVEIQGDHRQQLQTLLEQRGFKVKQAGG